MRWCWTILCLLDLGATYHSHWTGFHLVPFCYQSTFFILRLCMLFKDIILYSYPKSSALESWPTFSWEPAQLSTQFCFDSIQLVRSSGLRITHCSTGIQLKNINWLKTTKSATAAAATEWMKGKKLHGKQINIIHIEIEHKIRFCVVCVGSRRRAPAYLIYANFREYPRTTLWRTSTNTT